MSDKAAGDKDELRQDDDDTVSTVSTVDPDLELDEDEKDEGPPESNQQLEEFRLKSIEAAGKLKTLLTNLLSVVDRVDMSLNEGLFTGFSKEMRNLMMAEIIEDSREIEALSRVLFRHLKKVKKVNMSNEDKDTLILKYLVAKQNVDNQS